MKLERKTMMEKFCILWIQVLLKITKSTDNEAFVYP
jgi:hypothetical protein